MDCIEITGAEPEVIQQLSNYMNEGNAKLFIRSLAQYKTALDCNESYVQKEINEQSDGLGLLIPCTNYYINMKKSTLAFIGLLLDIRFTYGFASFVMELFGVNADAIKKLSDKEKCILLLVKSGSFSLDMFAVTQNRNVLCINKKIACECRNETACTISKCLVEEILESLISKKIISKKGLVYRYNY